MPNSLARRNAHLTGHFRRERWAWIPCGWGSQPTDSATRDSTDKRCCLPGCGGAGAVRIGKSQWFRSRCWARPVSSVTSSCARWWSFAPGPPGAWCMWLRPCRRSGRSFDADTTDAPEERFVRGITSRSSNNWVRSRPGDPRRHPVALRRSASGRGATEARACEVACDVWSASTDRRPAPLASRRPSTKSLGRPTCWPVHAGPEAARGRPKTTRRHRAPRPLMLHIRRLKITLKPNAAGCMDDPHLQPLWTKTTRTVCGHV